MDPLTIGAISGGLSAVTGAAGYFLSEGERKKMNQVIKDAYDRIANIPLPDIEKQKLILEMPEVQGILRPALEKFQEVAPSEYEQLMMDSGLMSDARSSLQAFDDIINAGGLDAEGRMILNQTRQQTGADIEAQRQSILQNMAARGVSGSGQELAMRLQGLQGSANQQAQAADRLAAQKEQARRQALMQKGQLASELAQTEFGADATRAQGLDSHQRFAQGLRADTERANINRLNQAQEYNLQQAQQLANQQTALRNEQQAYNKNLLQREFDNQMRKEQLMQGASGDLAKSYGSNAQAIQNLFGGLAGGVASTGAGFMTAAGPSGPGSVAPATKPSNIMTAEEAEDDNDFYGIGQWGNR